MRRQVSRTRPPSLQQVVSSNHQNPGIRHWPKRGRLDSAQQAFVCLPEATFGDEALGRIEDAASLELTRTGRFKAIVYTGELLRAQSFDFQHTVSIDVENGVRPVRHTPRFAIHHFHEDAGPANAVSGKVRN